MKKKYKQILVHLVPLCLIMALVLFHIQDNIAPKVFGDEYGYWATGAFLAGIDWSDISSLNAYYGWGYGFILSLILRLPLEMVRCYQLGIALNGVLLFGIYCIVFRLINEFIHDISLYAKGIIAFCVAILPSTLYYTQYTMSEVILTFLYWLLIWFEWKMLKRNSLINNIWIFFINSFMLSIHMRTVGILAVTAFFILVSFITSKYKKWKEFIFIFCVGILFVFFVFYVKNRYQEFISNSLVILKDNNEFSGQTQKIIDIFSLKGIYSCLKNLVGRIYSIGMNSYLFAVLGLFLGISTCIRKFQERKKIEDKEKLFLVCTFNSFSQILISSVYMIGAENDRFDILTYSRYHDFTIGALILFGIVYMLNNFPQKKMYRKLWIIVIGVLGSAKIITLIQRYDISLANTFIHNPNIFFWSRKVEKLNSIFIVTALFVIIIFILLHFLMKYNKYLGIVSICTLISLFTIYSNNYTFEKGCLSWSKKETKEVKEVKQIIEENEYEEILYFMVDDNVLYIDQLQTLLKEYEIHICNSEQIEKLSNIIILSSRFYDAKKLMDNGFSKMYESGYLWVWKR